MRKILLIVLLSFTFLYSKAQINAITESGDQVFSYKDGTWSYVGRN